MGAYPYDAAPQQLEELCVAVGLLELGLHLAVAHPGQGCLGVGVDVVPFVAARHLGQGVDDGEKLADVVGAVLEGADLEEFASCGEFDAAVFHYAGISLARGVYGPGGLVDVGIRAVGRGVGHRHPLVGGGDEK